MDSRTNRNKLANRSFENTLNPPSHNERVDTKSSTPPIQTMSSIRTPVSKIVEAAAGLSSESDSDQESIADKIQKLRQKENKNFIKQLQKRK